MEIGINLFCCDTHSITVDEKINLMIENGFYHTFTRSDDSSLDNEAFDKIKKSGIVFDFLHLPFKDINTLYFDCEDAVSMLKSLNDGIEKCSKHEIPLAILHLSSGEDFHAQIFPHQSYFIIPLALFSARIRKS